MRYLLDTSTCIRLIGKRSLEAVVNLLHHPPRDMAISVISFFELRCGIEKSRSPGRAEKALDKFLGSFNLIFLDGSAANEAARIMAHLETKGISISHPDLLIAGTARSRKMTLVTDKIEKFKGIQGLYLENWVDPV
ncbi:PIN domain-containing protein [Desulfospira joergensenii]|uniref:PIN domain-containing protein n=1 Tax=Desulfospira joergensenii TaxID=53329 RepID=UPI0003B62F9C|nr:PIN domain-containing protein [Desulfospira joergensenii]